MQPNFLVEKSNWVRKETLKVHKLAPETRIASSLSSVELFVALYYGKVLKYDPTNLRAEDRDRLIVSKGHGSICLYPILADLGFFDKKELLTVCKEGSFLGGIPDTLIPGYETINGSLGHGLGVASGVAIGLKRKNRLESVFVVLGDGELYEGSVWEAVMFAGYHKLDNLILIIDNNKICMLDYCSKILDLTPLADKFKAFGWMTQEVDGHNPAVMQEVLLKAKKDRNSKPKLIIAQTKKGKGVPKLENDSLCHVRSLSAQEVDALVEESSL
ncbi:MAG: transketolase [Candidatus Omnitrophica bacterium]|nr:transketolase [Candidatus Omnitrophota bacterium]